MNPHPSAPVTPIHALRAAAAWMRDRLMPGFLAAIAAGALAAAERPNILWIVVDDLGYRDLGCQGGEVDTPAIDGLAASGVRCTRGYVTAPVCCPSRAGMLSGRYQQRFGHEFNLLEDRPEHRTCGLPDGVELVPEKLGQVGYATGLFGKWHLGEQPNHHPRARGFDAFYGFLRGHHEYATDRRKGQDAARHPWMILRGYDPIPAPPPAEYLTDTLAAEACSFIGAKRDRPWMAMLSFNAVHTPLQSASRSVDQKAPFEDRRAVLKEMIGGLDRAVGRVLEAVRASGGEGHTLVFLVSDNGGPAVTGADNRPLRGEKGTLLEGGIRVPCLIAWPGTIPHRVHEQPVITLDMAATTLAAAGVPADGTEGIDLVPVLTGPRTEDPKRALFWRIGGSRAVIAGGRKLVKQWNIPWQLYDLEADPHEDRDLAGDRPQEVAELARRWEGWNAGNREPLWR